MEARGDEVIPEFLPKEYVSLERCELCQRAKLNATTGSPSSPMNLATRVTKRPTPRLNPPSTMGPSTRWTPDLYNRVRHHPQLNWGLSSTNTCSTTQASNQIQQWWLGFPNGNPNH